MLARNTSAPPREPPFPLAAAVGMFACAFAVVAWPWLSGAVTVPWDAKSQFLPQQVFLARSLAQGHAPFWAPNVFAGWPQIADPQSLIFSPLHFLLALLSPAPSFRAVDAMSFAMLFMGGVGMILLFRDRGWHVGGALVAALAFAFGGSCLSRLQHTGQIMSVAYLPLALWLLSRALERSSLLLGAAAGLVAGLMALGRDQVALIGLYLLAAFVLTHWLGGEGRIERLRKSFKPLAAGTAAGALLIALPLLMTTLLALDSNRPGIDYTEAGRGSLHPAHLLTLVFHDLYGASDPAVPYWGPSSFPWGPTGLFLAQNMGQLYTGAVPLVVLVSIGIVAGALWARETRFYTAAAAIVLLYALGWYTPAFWVMYELVPGVDLFRRPADATFVLAALLALLSGYVVHRWLLALPPPPVRHHMAAIGIGLALIATAAGLAISTGTTTVAVKPILFGIAWATGAVAVLVLARRFGRVPWMAALILTAFTTADFALNRAPNESTGLPPSTYDALRPDTPDETVVLLKRLLDDAAAPDRRDRVELTGIAYHWPNLSLIHGFDHLFGQNPLRLKDFSRATGVGDTVAVPEQRKFAPLFPSYRSALADLFGLRFIATGVPVEQIDKGLAHGDLNLIARTKNAYVYENPRALPRVMLLTDWRIVSFETLFRDGWPQADPRRTVLLEKHPGIAPIPALPATRTARISRYGTTVVAIDVDAPSDSLLLLNDVWHPWWRASVDGAPAEILKANALFRAVVIARGHHTVRFEFHPIAGALQQLMTILGISAAAR